MNDPRQMLLRNIFSNWVAMAIGIIIPFFMSPFLVHTLGKEHYGIWALVFSIAYYMNLLDAGMKQSLARYIPRYYASRDYEKINQVINSSNFIYAITGTLVIIASLVIALFFLWAFKIDAANVATMRVVLIVIGIDQAIMFYFMAGTAIGPFHRYDVSNVIGVISSIANAVIIVFFLSRGYGLVALALITIIIDLIKNVIRRMYQQRLVPELEFSIKYIKKDALRELLRYGIISFFIVVSWMVVFNTSNLLIGIFISATAVTYYSIAGTLVNYMRVMVNTVGIPLVPAISHIDAKGDYSQVAGLYAKLVRYLFYFTASICAITILFGAKFIYLWMGQEFTPTIHVMYILIVPVSIYLPQIVANSIMLGMGKHKPLFYILAVEAVLNLSLSVALINPFGIYGVAMGTAISQFAIYTYIFPYMFHRIIGADLGLFYKNSIKMIINSLIFTVPVSFLLRQINTLAGWPGLFIDGAILGIFVTAGFWLTALLPDDRLRLKSKFRRSAVAEVIEPSNTVVKSGP